MIEQILRDQRRRPDIFHFFGAIEPDRLISWLRERRFTIPDDLRQLWCETGGGDVFETETILGPFGRTDLADDVDSVNQFHWAKGMPAEWVIFHTGIGGLSVVQTASGNYASVREGSYEVQQSFASLADWYVSLIRPEYVSRYGLE